MLHSIKNSVFGRFLQVFLIGYFLISSITISNTFTGLVTQFEEVHSTKFLVNRLLKKIFKCDSIQEFDDFDAKSKTDKSTAELQSADYLVPLHINISGLLPSLLINGNISVAHPIFIFAFYNKIHLPPPEPIL